MRLRITSREVGRTPTNNELLAALPDTFRYSEARQRISERQLRRLIEDGQITAMSRGHYRKSDWLGDEDLIEVAAKSSSATICLRSALARHDLNDDIPSEIEIAIRAGHGHPSYPPPSGGDTSIPTPSRSDASSSTSAVSAASASTPQSAASSTPSECDTSTARTLPTRRSSVGCAAEDSHRNCSQWHGHSRARSPRCGRHWRSCCEPRFEPFLRFFRFVA